VPYRIGVWTARRSPTRPKSHCVAGVRVRDTLEAVEAIRRGRRSCRGHDVWEYGLRYGRATSALTPMAAGEGPA